MDALFLPKLGNLKIGKLERGLPQMLQKIHITSTSKSGEEAFQPHPDFKDDYQRSSISVILPYREESFEKGLVSFIKINGIRFMAKDINGSVYLIPLDHNYADPSNPFPVFKYGSTEVHKEMLDMKYRGILYCQIDGYKKFGAFHFKTESVNSIAEISNTIETYFDGAPQDAPYMDSFVLEVHTKYTGLSSGQEITYVRLVKSLEPVTYDMETLDKIYAMAKFVAKNRREAIRRAVDFERYKSEYFGRQVKIELDNISYSGEIVSGNEDSKQKSEPFGVPALIKVAPIEPIKQGKKETKKAVGQKTEKSEEQKKSEETVKEAEKQKGKEEKQESAPKRKRGRPPKKTLMDVVPEEKKEEKAESKPSLTPKQKQELERISEEMNMPLRLLETASRYIPVEKLRDFILSNNMRTADLASYVTIQMTKEK